MKDDVLMYLSTQNYHMKKAKIVVQKNPKKQGLLSC